MKRLEQEFCMREFRPAIAIMAVLVVIIIGWTLWRQCPGSFVGSGQAAGPGQGQGMLRMQGIAPAAAKAPMTPPIDVNAKMLHAYWGNCNQCHVTTGGGKPVSKVMAGAPVSIAQTMTHKYWGNCLLCHQVVDGFQANGQFLDKKQPRGPQAQPQAQAAAFGWLTAQSVGLSLAPVTQAMMQKFNLLEDNALLVIEVAPGSVADKAGLAQGDEIVRVNRTKVKNIPDFETGLNSVAPGGDLKIGIIRGKTARNLMVALPKDILGKQAAAAAFTVAAPPQQPAQAGLVAVAASGPGLNAQVAPLFESAPYFVLVDTAGRAFKVEANPNAGVLGYGTQTGQLMANWGVSGVVAGSFGQNASATLAGLRIAAFPGVAGAVQDAVNAYGSGSLAPQGLTAQAAPGAPGAPGGQGGVQTPAVAYPQTLY